MIRHEDDCNLLVTQKTNTYQNNGEDLIAIRENMRKLIFSLAIIDIDSNNVSFVQAKDELNFLYEYKDFLKQTGTLFPRFIFDNIYLEEFQKCVEYKTNNHTLLETEIYYINNIKSTSHFSNNKCNKNIKR
jgi:hypothetical protein